MTTQQLLWMIVAYLVALVAVVFFARATTRRVLGALLGGAVVGVMLLGVIALGESIGWWRVPMMDTRWTRSAFPLGVARTEPPPPPLLDRRLRRRWSVGHGAAA